MPKLINDIYTDCYDFFKFEKPVQNWTGCPFWNIFCWTSSGFNLGIVDR